MKKLPMHILLRYSDRMRGVDTLEEHKKLLRSKGYVWWGKFGQGVSREIVGRLQSQVDGGVTTYLYLVNGKRLTARGRLLGVQGGGARASFRQDDRTGVPLYYREEPCAVWLKLSGIAAISHKATMARLVRYKSRFEAPDLSSTSGVMYVAHGKSGPARPVKVIAPQPRLASIEILDVDADQL